MTDRYDLAVIGAGLVGLATARAYLVANPGKRVVVLEKEQQPARHQSGRNSGVVHAGLYYQPGSLKAELCRAGRVSLLAFADEHEIPYRVGGKLVVATTEAELPRLESLAARGRANGIQGLRELRSEEIQSVEPHAVGVRALHVPETAVIDFSAVCTRLASVVMGLGATLLLGSEVIRLHRDGPTAVLGIRGESSVRAERVVACAGLQSDRVRELADGDTRDYQVAPFRGDFFRLSEPARNLVRSLIYPVPDPSFPFLGVHFTRRLDDDVWVGPNAVPALARERYTRTGFDRRDAWSVLTSPGIWRLARTYARTGAGEIWRDVHKAAAVRRMRRYVPELEARDVSYAHSGTRAQVVRNDGTLVDDFLVEQARNVTHIINAPSPAATSCLAIADWIVGKL